MAESAPAHQRFDSNNSTSVTSDASSSVAGSPRSLSPTTGWAIRYKTIPKKTELKGVWDGFQTKEEFMMMHLR